MKKPFRLDMLTLEGPPRKRGQIYGETLREKIHAMVEEIKEFTVKKTGEEGDALFKEFVETTHYLADAEKLTPHLVEEVCGIAEGANMPFTTAFALQYLEGLVSGSPLSSCSAVGVWGQAGIPTLLAQTADNSSAWHDKLTLLHIIYPDSDVEIFTMTFSGLVAVYGMNSYGLGVCINSLGELKSGKSGLSAPLVSRSILEKRTLQEADQFIRSVKHVAGENFVVGGPERVRSYECSANKVAEYAPPAGTRLFHTNHCLANDDKIDIAALSLDVQANIPKSMENTRTRMATMEEHLSDPGKTVGVEEIKAALSTHGQHSICNHLDDHNPQVVTNYGIIMELSENPVLHLSSGPPCYTQFWRFKF